jgi:hypothetical protein
MNDAQLYLAIGLPAALYPFGFTTSILVVFWQARSFEKLMTVQYNALNQRFTDLDSRLDKIDSRLSDLEKGSRLVR